MERRLSSMFVAIGNGAGATHIEHCLKGNEIARMRRDDLNREILRLAAPNILSNLTVPLIGSVDVVLMGGLSAAHIGALGVGTMIFNILYWNFGFLRMGTTGITAQAVGRQDDEAAGLTLVRALISAGVISLVILLLQVPIGRAAMHLMNVDEGQSSLVSTYFSIRLWAIPATLSMYVLLGWFLGLQNAIYPLLLTVLVNVVNMALSAWLVLGAGLGVAGVAWGTVGAQYSGLAIGLLLVAFRYRNKVSALRWQSIRELSAFVHFLRINGDIFVRTVCLTLAYGFFYSRSAAIGQLTLAANTILYQFMIWMAYGIDGFAFAAESLVGKYTGAGNQNRLKAVIRRSFLWGGGFAVLLAVCYGVAGPAIVDLFTSDAEVASVAVPFLWWVVALPVLSFASFMWDGVFVGLTASRSMRNSMAIALALFLAVWFMHPTPDNSHLWLSFAVFMTSRGLLQGLLYLRKGTSLR